MKDEKRAEEEPGVAKLEKPIQETGLAAPEQGDLQMGGMSGTVQGSPRLTLKSPGPSGCGLQLFRQPCGL